jgi:hypothetical protein
MVSWWRYLSLKELRWREGFPGKVILSLRKKSQKVSTAQARGLQISSKTCQVLLIINLVQIADAN